MVPSWSDLRPIEVYLQFAQRRLPRNNFAVLQLSHHDTGCNSDIICKLKNVAYSERSTRNEFLQLILRNKKVRRPLIRFMFLFRTSCKFLFIYEQALFAVEYEMACFVEEGEPKMIISLV